MLTPVMEYKMAGSQSAVNKSMSRETVMNFLVGDPLALFNLVQMHISSECKCTSHLNELGFFNLAKGTNGNNVSEFKAIDLLTVRSIFH